LAAKTPAHKMWMKKECKNLGPWCLKRNNGETIQMRSWLEFWKKRNKETTPYRRT